MAFDYNKPSRDLAVTLIRLSTGYDVPVTKIVFGTPTMLDNLPLNPADENTFVPATVDEYYDGRFTGDNGFMYRRIPLEEVSPTGTAYGPPISYPTTVHALLPYLNGLYKTQWGVDDILDGPVVNESTPFTLRAHPCSLAWIGRNPNAGNIVPTEQEDLEVDLDIFVYIGGSHVSDDPV